MVWLKGRLGDDLVTALFRQGPAEEIRLYQVQARVIAESGAKFHHQIRVNLHRGEAAAQIKQRPGQVTFPGADFNDFVPWLEAGLSSS